MLQTPINLSLKATALNFGYPGNVLFNNFSADISPGITLIRGGDGRGKTTLLRLLAGALPVQSGHLRLADIDLQTQSERYKAAVFLAEPRFAAVNAVAAVSAVNAVNAVNATHTFDALDVLDFFALQRSKYTGFSDEALANVTHGLGLQEHLHKQLFMLSTGSKRKVFLAAASASSTKLTLLDEPCAALDTASIRFIWRWLQMASSANHRIFVVADYTAPAGVHLTQTIDLGD